MNEPHAPMFYQGYYHIFYQANPHAPNWDNIQWGHLINKDMIHWKDMGLALETQLNGIDPDGCWSGSSCIDLEGVPTIFYTAGNDRRFPNQAIAIAKAESNDITLKRWIKNDQLAIEQTENDGWIGEFRDPFVWIENNTYYVLVGTGSSNNEGGNAIVYSSTDMVGWKNHGFLMEYDFKINQEVGHVWELPVLLPVKDEKGNLAFHILLLCACQVENEVVETYYWSGEFNYETKKFHKFHDRANLLDLGYGTFTGPSGFVTPDGRSVLFTIAQGKRERNNEYRSGWAHNGGLPIELYCAENELRINPIREVYSLQKKLLIKEKDIAIFNLNQFLSKQNGNQYYIKIVAKCDYLGIRTYYNDKSVEVYYDKINRIFAAKDENNVVISKRRGELDEVALKEDEIELEYFLDHSMIEVYCNHRKSITLRNYSNGTDRNLRIITHQDINITSFELWEMDSAY
jgi:sucrose-6-phosphate hydrolase SacC (GH32 family)